MMTNVVLELFVYILIFMLAGINSPLEIEDLTTLGHI